MLIVGDQKIVFHTSILMKPAQVATYAPENAHGFVFKLVTDKLDASVVNIPGGSRATIDGNLITLPFPFLISGSMSEELTITTEAGLRMNVLFAASPAGDFLLVHLQGYRYGAKE